MIVTLKRLRKEYDENEEQNNHLENYYILADYFGTDYQVEIVNHIMHEHEKMGFLEEHWMDYLLTVINPYYYSSGLAYVNSDNNPLSRKRNS